MTTQQEQLVDGTVPDTTLARCQKTRHCRCGQEIDDQEREHCPRCGTTLRQR